MPFLLAPAIPDVGFTIRVPTDPQAFGEPDLAIPCVPLDLLPQHPSEGHAGSGVRRLYEAGGLEVTMRLGEDLRVGVRHGPCESEGGHERNTLAYTGRQDAVSEFVETPARSYCQKLWIR